MTIHQAQPDGLRTISRAELSQLLGDHGVTIIDVRPTAAYNGWRLNDEARGWSQDPISNPIEIGEPEEEFAA